MIARSPYPDLEIPNVSWPALILNRARSWGARPALVDAEDGRTISYAQLTALVEGCAAGLTARGIGKGDVVGLYSPNTIEYPIVLLGATLAGAAVTTVNALMTVDEVARQLTDARARLLVTVPALAASSRAACETIGIREIVCMGDAAGTTSLETLLHTDGPPATVVVDPFQDLAVLPYSSGTTGLPKGVMLTHRNLVANVLQIAHGGLIARDEVVACVLPMFHIYGMVVVVGTGLYTGATIVVLRRFQLESFCRALDQYQVTLVPGVPPIAAAMATVPLDAGYDFSRLRAIMSGAAPIAPATVEACVRRFGCRFRQGYGMTEASPVTHLSCHEAPLVTPMDSVGVCVPNTECCIVDPLTDQRLEAGALGEICVRGPQVMKGYLNRPAETQAVIDSSGWLHTGDIGRLDRDGNCYIVDRLKELIKCNAYQVAPAELEALLLTHPQVRDAAVIPVPDPTAGEVPKAFVVARTDQIDSAEILQFVADRVAPYKRIRTIEIVTEIPRAASGKILRRVLIERDRRGTGTTAAVKTGR
jgi:acyl-CoA synthetase (AMP-forming)/AMP-acid ligase II